MSDHSLGAAAMPFTTPAGATPAPAERSEWVLRGLFSAFLAVVAGTTLTVALWRAGHVASLGSFVTAAGAVVLYSRAAGSAPRQGVAPLVLLILLGLAASFLAVVASDLSDLYTQLDGAVFMTRSRFILDNLLRADVLGVYGRDLIVFAVFGALGAVGTLVRVLRRAH